jgi:2TM domain
MALGPVVTVLIWASAIPVNVVVTPQFPWSVFVVAGTGIGLFFHWFGYRHTDRDIRRRQQRIEARAVAR